MIQAPPRSAVLLLCAVGLGAWHPGVTLAQARATDALPGCYRLEIGGWEPARAEMAVRTAGYEPPPVFQLIDRWGSGIVDHGNRIARPLLGDPDPHHAAFWHVREPDSVYVVWSNGFSGVRLELRRDGRALRGRVRVFSDEPGGLRATARAAAGRIACPDIPPRIDAR